MSDWHIVLSAYEPAFWLIVFLEKVAFGYQGKVGEGEAWRRHMCPLSATGGKQMDWIGAGLTCVS